MQDTLPQHPQRTYRSGSHKFDPGPGILTGFRRMRCRLPWSWVALVYPFGPMGNPSRRSGRNKKGQNAKVRRSLVGLVLALAVPGAGAHRDVRLPADRGSATTPTTTAPFPQPAPLTASFYFPCQACRALAALLVGP